MTLGQLLGILVFVAATACAVHALMTKTREPTSAIAWVLACFALPGLGVLLYLTVGQERIVRRRTFEVRLAAAIFKARMAGGRRARRTRAPGSWLERMVEHPIVDGNDVGILQHGEGAYPAMLEAIGAARTSVEAQFYIFDDDQTGRRFREALEEKAREGLAVRVLYDAIGSHRTSARFWQPLRQAGAQVAPFMPLSPFKRRWQINMRNHRKLLVLDGGVAFTGSINVSDRHLVESGGRSKDVAFRIAGPVVPFLRASFARDWNFACDEDLAHGLDFEGQERAGRQAVQVVESGPDKDGGEFREVLVASVHQAQRFVKLATPYFVPDAGLMDALLIAAQRGIAVVLVLPQKGDHRIIDLVSRGYVHRLLQAGGTVYERPDYLVHMKLAVIDDALTIVGSSNLDNRSLFLNFELDLVVPGRAFARRTCELIDAEIAASRFVSPLRDLHQSLPRRFVQRVATLWAPVL